jgi:hypothetical protein
MKNATKPQLKRFQTSMPKTLSGVNKLKHFLAAMPAWIKVNSLLLALSSESG